MKAILIPADLEQPIREFALGEEPRNCPTLQGLYDVIGCTLVQKLPFPNDLDGRTYGPGEGDHHPRADLITDEEGKYNHADKVNERATTLMFKGGLLFPGDYICGNAVVVGANNRTGMWVDVPEDITVAAIERQTASL